MQIIIDESEILAAIKSYIIKQGIVTAGREIAVELTAGRGANGHRATIEITKVEEDSPTVNDAFTTPAEKAVKKAVETVDEIVETAAKETPKPAPKKTAAPKADPAPTFPPAVEPEPEPPATEKDPGKPEPGLTLPKEPAPAAMTTQGEAAAVGDKLFNF